jgi:thiol-disulfide isomerase/thioredoxin
MTHREPLPPAAPRRRAPGAALAALLVAGATAALAQGPGADAVLRDFQPSGDFVLEVDGEAAAGAEILFSDRVPGYLLLSSKLPEPTLILPASGTVETLSLMKLARRAGGVVDILADAELVPAGRFTIEKDGEQIRFAVGERRVVMKPKPYLLGLQKLETMLGYGPEYRTAASAYRPDEATLAALRGQGQAVRVRVYFGSWCPTCKRLVPNVLKVAEALAGSRVAFEFYGLPKQFDGEPAAEADDVHGVPTGVVWVGGREVGRIEGDGWRRPESTLRAILANGRVG